MPSSWIRPSTRQSSIGATNGTRGRERPARKRLGRCWGSFSPSCHRPLFLRQAASDRGTVPRWQAAHFARHQERAASQNPSSCTATRRQPKRSQVFTYHHRPKASIDSRGRGVWQMTDRGCAPENVGDRQECLSYWGGGWVTDKNVCPTGEAVSLRLRSFSILPALVLPAAHAY